MTKKRKSTMMALDSYLQQLATEIKKEKGGRRERRSRRENVSGTDC